MDTTLSLPGTERRLRFRLPEGWQSLLGALVVLALIPIVFRMEPARFKPFFHDLDRATGGLVDAPFTGEWWWAWRFLALGLSTTILVALVSILLSLPLATVFALMRLSSPAWLRIPTIALIESIRALPVLLFIWFTSRFLARQGMEVAEFWPVVIALTLYTMAVNAETLRAGILALEKGQMEAARSLGLTYLQAMRYVILPQTFRHMLPPIIAQFATLLKDTSLGYIIGLRELTRHGEILYQGQRNPMETIYIVAVIYFFLNYLLGQLAVWTHQRLSG